MLTALHLLVFVKLWYSALFMSYFLDNVFVYGRFTEFITLALYKLTCDSNCLHCMHKHYGMLTSVGTPLKHIAVLIHCTDSRLLSRIVKKRRPTARGDFTNERWNQWRSNHILKQNYNIHNVILRSLEPSLAIGTSPSHVVQQFSYHSKCRIYFGCEHKILLLRR
jgi:hypothetical protein